MKYEIKEEKIRLFDKDWCELSYLLKSVKKYKTPPPKLLNLVPRPCIAF